MKNRNALVVFLLAWGVAWAAGQDVQGKGTQEKGAPIMYVENSLVMLGKVRPRSVTPGRFSFTNLGERDLVIKNLRADCGCTVVSLAKTVLAPGEEGWLDVEFHADNRRVGAQHNVYLETNDPNNGNVVLVLGAEVEPDMDWNPKFAQLDWPVPAGYAGEFNFVTLMGEPKKCIGVKSRSGVTIPVLAKSEGSGFTIRYTVSEKAEFVSSDFITVETDSADFPVVGINVYFKKASKLQVLRTTKILTMVVGEEPLSFRFKIVRTDRGVVHIKEIEASQQSYVTRIIQNDSEECVVEISLRPETSWGPCDGYLMVKTDEETVRVPIKCQVITR